jgi:6-phosphogluconolactonase
MPNRTERGPVARRITLTPIVLNAAGDVTFLVAGAGKAERLREVLESSRVETLLPARLIRPASGALHWMADVAAAVRVRRAA